MQIFRVELVRLRFFELYRFFQVMRLESCLLYESSWTFVVIFQLVFGCWWRQAMVMRVLPLIPSNVLVVV